VIRLGLRLAMLGGKLSIVPTVLAGVAVGFGTAILLFALSFQPALDVRYDRGAWRETPGPGSGEEQPPQSTLVSLTHDFIDGRPIERVDVVALSAGAPVPPALARLPEPGEAFVSPALRELIATRPADELADRYGRIVGEIGAQGLSAPNELAVVQGLDSGTLRASGARAVAAFDTESQGPMLDLAVQLIVGITVVGAIAPVAVFVATATRLAAARRERRLAALRLSGATPRQVAMLAALDALLISAPGAVLGVVLFMLLRPFVATIPLAQLTWFPDAIVPPLLPAVALVIAVPVVGVAAAIVALRRLTISPLGVARRAPAKPLSRIRLVPLAVAPLLLVVAPAVAPVSSELSMYAIIGAFLGIILGIVIAGPWLTAIVGRVIAARGGVIRLLAGRRLIDEPRSSFGAVAGVVMAVFVACTFFGFIAFLTVAFQPAVPVRAATVYAPIPGGMGEVALRLADEVRGIEGVEGVVVVREAVLRRPGTDDVIAEAWIAPCAALLATFDSTTACGDGDAHVLGDTDVLADPIVAAGHRPAASQVDLEGPPDVEVPLLTGVVVDQLIPGENEGLGVPEVMLEPNALADDGLGIRPAFLFVATNGDSATVERVRTSIEAALPTSGPATGADLAAMLTRVVDELARVVSLGVVLTLVVAGCSLAIAVTSGLLDRRRPFALLRLSGVKLAHLRAVLVLEAAAPLIAVAVASGVLGVAFSQVIMRALAGEAVPLPDGSLVLLVAGSVGAALLIVLAVLPLVGRVTNLEETRFE
jgi:hypothetical protein